MFGRIDFSKLDLMDALDLAILIETEALERYEMFAEQLGYRGGNDPSSIFKDMAVHEAKHGEDLLARRKALFGSTPLRVSRDDIFDIEAPDHGAPRWNMSAKHALEIALSSEKKAYAFYDLAMDHVSEPTVRALFAELRDEETEHVRRVSNAIDALPAGSDVPLEDQDED